MYRRLSLRPGSSSACISCRTCFLRINLTAQWSLFLSGWGKGCQEQMWIVPRRYALASGYNNLYHVVLEMLHSFCRITARARNGMMLGAAYFPVALGAGFSTLANIIRFWSLSIAVWSICARSEWGTTGAATYSSIWHNSLEAAFSSWKSCDCDLGAILEDVCRKESACPLSGCLGSVPALLWTIVSFSRHLETSLQQRSMSPDSGLRVSFVMEGPISGMSRSSSL